MSIPKALPLKNICVWGMPGSGKTTLAHRLKNLSVPVYDSDEIIFKNFSPQTMADFKNLEKATLDWAAYLDYPHLLVVGGSSPVNFSSTLKNHYHVLWLHIPLEQAYKNFTLKERFGLNIKTYESYLSLYDERCKFYSAADYVADTFLKAYEYIENHYKIFENP